MQPTLASCWRLWRLRGLLRSCARSSQTLIHDFSSFSKAGFKMSHRWIITHISYVIAVSCTVAPLNESARFYIFLQSIERFLMHVNSYLSVIIKSIYRFKYQNLISSLYTVVSGLLFIKFYLLLNSVSHLQN